MWFASESMSWVPQQLLQIRPKGATVEEKVSHCYFLIVDGNLKGQSHHLQMGASQASGSGVGVGEEYEWTSPWFLITVN